MLYQRTRICPYCRERTRAAATVCPHCTRDIVPVRRLEPVTILLLALFVGVMLAGLASSFVAPPPTPTVAPISGPTPRP